MTQTPSPALSPLIDGYRRFHETEWGAERERWEKLATGQQPKVLVIACSDSRVDPGQIFDVAPGEIFVVRNVAALVPPCGDTPGQHGVSAALEYAVQVLKVSEVVVLGHGLCGGCKAALTQQMHGAERGAGGFVADWIGMLDTARVPVAERYGTTGREAEEAMEHAGVQVSLDNLRTFPFVREAERSGALRLTGAHFSIADGVLSIRDQQSGRFEPVG